MSARPAPTSPSFALSGFQIPESAQYDPVDDVYYVSNVADPFGGGGFVSRIAATASGDVSGEPDYEWITGLTSPFGMALDGDLLYVVDRDGLYVFEIDRTAGTAAQVDFIALGVEGSLLNDVCLGPDGSIYVTDTGLDLVTGPTGTDAIYRIVDGDVSVLLAGQALEGPNGCFVDKANVFCHVLLEQALPDEFVREGLPRCGTAGWRHRQRRARRRLPLHVELGCRGGHSYEPWRQPGRADSRGRDAR